MSNDIFIYQKYFCKDKGVIENVKRPIDGKPLGAAALKRLGRTEWAFTIKNSITLCSVWYPSIRFFEKQININWIKV